MERDCRPNQSRTAGIVVDVDRLRREMALRTWSASDLAEIAGVSRPSVTNALKARAIRPATLRKIIIALNASKAIDGADRIL
jgi:transcriptional regulator with XRE-family HTH domain